MIRGGVIFVCAVASGALVQYRGAPIWFCAVVGLGVFLAITSMFPKEPQ